MEIGLSEVCINIRSLAGAGTIKRQYYNAVKELHPKRVGRAFLAAKNFILYQNGYSHRIILNELIKSGLRFVFVAVVLYQNIRINTYYFREFKCDCFSLINWSCSSVATGPPSRNF